MGVFTWPLSFLGVLVERAFDKFVGCVVLAGLIVRLRRFAVGAESLFALTLSLISGLAPVPLRFLWVFEPGFLSEFEVVLFFKEPDAFALAFRPKLRGFLLFEVLSGRRLSRFGGGAMGRTRVRILACFRRNPKIDSLGSTITSNCTSSLETESSSRAISRAASTVGPFVIIQSIPDYFRRFLVRPSPAVRLD